jgi:hypothetical protein
MLVRPSRVSRINIIQITRSFWEITFSPEIFCTNTPWIFGTSVSAFFHSFQYTLALTPSWSIGANWIISWRAFETFTFSALKSGSQMAFFQRFYSLLNFDFEFSNLLSFQWWAFRRTVFDACMLVRPSRVSGIVCIQITRSFCHITFSPEIFCTNTPWIFVTSVSAFFLSLQYTLALTPSWSIGANWIISWRAFETFTFFALKSGCLMAFF